MAELLHVNRIAPKAQADQQKLVFTVNSSPYPIAVTSLFPQRPDTIEPGLFSRESVWPPHSANDGRPMLRCNSVVSLLPSLGVSSLNSEPTANITLRCRGFLSTGQILAHKLKRLRFRLRRAGVPIYTINKIIEARRNEI